MACQALELGLLLFDPARSKPLAITVQGLANNLQETIDRAIGWGIELEPAVIVSSTACPAYRRDQGTSRLVHRPAGGRPLAVRELHGNVFHKALSAGPDIATAFILSYRGT